MPKVRAIVDNKLVNVLLLLFSTLLALLAGELFLRLFFPVNPPRLIVESGPADWILWNEEGEAVGLIPGFRGRLVSSEFDISIQLNEHGFRDQTFALKRLSSATRICVLGDSFTFGFGVEASETFSQRLAKILRSRGYDVEVYNLGVPGTATAFQYRLFQRYLRLKPDIVILGILAAYADKAGNDLIDNLEDPEKKAAPKQLAPTSVKSASCQAGKTPEGRRLEQMLFGQLRSVRRWLLQSSHFYRRLELLIGQEYPRWLGHWQAEANRQRVENGWRITQEWLLRFQALAQQQKFALVLLHIPFPYFRSDENSKMSRLIKELAAAHDIFFVDQLLPTMQSGPWQPRDLYFVLDGHWRARAHQLCAEVLSDFLMTQNLLPSP